MNDLGVKQFRVLLGTAGLFLVSTAGHAALVSENFDDVTGLASNTTVRTLADVLTNSPAQLPTGSIWAATTLAAADLNVRRTDNTINTSTGSNGFNSFFSPAAAGNNFLVLGDQGGDTTGNPTGGLVGQAFAFAVPFHVGPSDTSLTISFDWAFDGTDSSTAALQRDGFYAGLIGGSNLSLANFLSGNPASLFAQVFVNQSSPSFTSASFSGTYSVPQGDYLFAFVQTEAPTSNLITGAQPTNTAVGIDNISVSAVPIPAAAWLLGSGLVGLMGMGRRKSGA